MRERDHGDEKGHRRGRPRSEAVERAILEAVVALLEDGVPLSALSIERIARTAGVGKATIYRRWQGAEELFVDVLREIEPPDPELPGDSAVEDLRIMLESLRRRGLAQRNSALLHNVTVEMKSRPKLWREYRRTVIDPRRATTLAVIRRGIADGEFRGDLGAEMINDMMIGPMLMRTLHRPGASLDEDLPDRIIRTALQGLSPHAAATRDPRGPSGTRDPDGPSGTRDPDGSSATRDPDGSSATRDPDGPSATRGPSGARDTRDTQDVSDTRDTPEAADPPGTGRAASPGR
ncbi:TetR/AcrR family transcriptional regulator C-terminal ligand-binding domain-containing protein [Streptomyces sp. NPDC012623]|uniref:TetR/AcrR family transcriptional regulator n=1 Tax=unclassified Streptomyces TaxID=2593676 RepID=UPI0036945767